MVKILIAAVAMLSLCAPSASACDVEIVHSSVTVEEEPVAAVSNPVVRFEDVDVRSMAFASLILGAGYVHCGGSVAAVPKEPITLNGCMLEISPNSEVAVAVDGDERAVVSGSETVWLRFVGKGDVGKGDGGN